MGPVSSPNEAHWFRVETESAESPISHAPRLTARDRLPRAQARVNRMDLQHCPMRHKRSAKNAVSRDTWAKRFHGQASRQSSQPKILSPISGRSSNGMELLSSIVR